MKDLSLWFADYLDALRGRSFSVRSIRVESFILAVFHREFWGDQDFRGFGEADFYGYHQFLQQRLGTRGRKLSPRSVHRYLWTVKRFVSWMFRRGQFLVNPVERVKVQGPSPAQRKIPSQDQMAKILEGISGTRERALFELMYSSGLRVSEVLTLEVSDLRMEERILLIRSGKGRKDRFVPFCQVARMHLLKYLKGERLTMVRGLEESQKRFLFLWKQGAMTWKMLWKRWNRYLRTVDLGDEGFTIHSIRHATATHLLENGASVRYVQELLGHECLTTTQRYTRPTTDRIRSVYRSFHPRETEFFMEIDQEYLDSVEKLKQELGQ